MNGQRDEIRSGSGAYFNAGLRKSREPLKSSNDVSVKEH